jgi:hypothetical protein
VHFFRFQGEPFSFGTDVFCPPKSGIKNLALKQERSKRLSLLRITTYNSIIENSNRFIYVGCNFRASICTNVLFDSTR